MLVRFSAPNFRHHVLHRHKLVWFGCPAGDGSPCRSPLHGLFDHGVTEVWPRGPSSARSVNSAAQVDIIPDERDKHLPKSIGGNVTRRIMTERGHDDMNVNLRNLQKEVALDVSGYRYTHQRNLHRVYVQPITEKHQLTDFGNLYGEVEEDGSGKNNVVPGCQSNPQSVFEHRGSPRNISSETVSEAKSVNPGGNVGCNESLISPETYTNQLAQTSLPAQTSRPSSSSLEAIPSQGMHPDRSELASWCSTIPRRSTERT